MAHGAAARRVGPAGEASDAELVRAVRAGGGGAFELLVRRHRGWLRRVVLGVVRDGSEADDAVQQALLQAFAGLSRWSGTAPFSSWLARIAVNEARLRLRRSRRLQAAADQLARHGGPRPDPEQEAAGREEVARVTAALPRLPARLREVLQLASLADLSHADVARRLGLSEGAVKVRLHRAREALRGMLPEVRPRPRTPPLVLARGRPTRNPSRQHRTPLLD